MQTQKTYRMSPEAVAKQERQGALTALGITAFGLFLVFVVQKMMGVASGGMSLFAIALWVVVLAVLWQFNARRERRSWSSYELILDESGVFRRQAGMQEVQIRREEVIRVEEPGNAGLFIRTADAHRAIHVPPGLAGYEEVRETVKSWPPLEGVTTQADPRAAAVLVGNLVVLVLLIIALNSNSLGVALPLSLMVVGWDFWVLQDMKNNPNIEEKRKRRFRWFCAGMAVLLGLHVLSLLGQ